MKAVVLHEYGGPDNLKFEDWDDPVAGRGEVLVRVAAASVNPIDYKMRSGSVKDRMPIDLPYVLGRDISGIVRSVGAGVTGFEPGDHVFALAIHTYAELCVVKASDLAKIPEGLGLVTAGSLPLVLMTGEQLVRLGTGIQSGETVLIAGALGGVGRSAVRTAKDAGAKVIAGVRAKQLKEAEALGADQVIALDDDAAMAKLGFVDAVGDTVGGPTGQMLLGKVKPGGIFATVAGLPVNAALHPTIKAVRIQCEPDPEHLLKLAHDVLAGKLTIPVDRMLALADAAEGHALAEKGGIGKILLLA